MIGTKMTVIKNGLAATPEPVGLRRLERVEVVAPFEHHIELNGPLLTKDIASSVLEYVGDRVLHHTVAFHNEDKDHFDFHDQFVALDSRLSLKENYQYEWTSITEKADEEIRESEEINLDDFVDFAYLSAAEDAVKLKALPRAQMIIQKTDIDLSNVAYIEEINWQVETDQLGECLTALSFDEGRTWYGLHESSWVKIDISDMYAFYQNGIDAKKLQQMNSTKYHLIRENSDKMRFAFLLNRPSFDDQASSSLIKIYTSYAGEYIVADTKKYQYRYHEKSKTLIFTFVEDGIFTFNYIDSIV